MADGRDIARIALVDLTPGTRVVIDIPEGPEGSAPATAASKDRIAHAIKIGTGVINGPAPAAGHTEHTEHGDHH